MNESDSPVVASSEEMDESDSPVVAAAANEDSFLLDAAIWQEAVLMDAPVAQLVQHDDDDVICFHSTECDSAHERNTNNLAWIRWKTTYKMINWSNNKRPYLFRLHWCDAISH